MEDGVTARILGIVSLGIGIAELAAPDRIESLLGIGNGGTTGILRALGVREVLHGLDLLGHETRRPESGPGWPGRRSTGRSSGLLPGRRGGRGPLPR